MASISFLFSPQDLNSVRLTQEQYSGARRDSLHAWPLGHWSINHLNFLFPYCSSYTYLQQRSYTFILVSHCCWPEANLQHYYDTAETLLLLYSSETFLSPHLTPCSPNVSLPNCNSHAKLFPLMFSALLPGF